MRLKIRFKLWWYKIKPSDFKFIGFNKLNERMLITVIDYNYYWIIREKELN